MNTTKTMSNISWGDFSSKIDREELSFYSHREWKDGHVLGKRILLFSHALNLTGAPIALLNTSRGLVEDGYDTFVVCDMEGPLGDDFLTAGVNLIVYPNAYRDSAWLRELGELFDVVLLNTIIFILTIKPFSAYFKNVIWWLRESEFIFEDSVKKAIAAGAFKAVGDVSIPENVTVLCVSELVKGLVWKFFGYKNAQVVPTCILDHCGGVVDLESQDDGKGMIDVLQVGSLDFNKGQDVLINAISSLPQDVFEKCRFTFVGDSGNVDSEILRLVQAYSSMFFNIRLLPAMSHDDLMSLYPQNDIVVVSSRQESLSVVAIEAMMFGKVCVCTDNTGLRQFVGDGGGLIYFRSGDPLSLCERIEYAVRNYADLSATRKSARTTYEKYFSPQNHMRALRGYLAI